MLIQEKGTPRWVEPVAWDADGALYSLWGSQRGVVVGAIAGSR